MTMTTTTRKTDQELMELALKAALTVDLGEDVRQQCWLKDDPEIQYGPAPVVEASRVYNRPVVGWTRLVVATRAADGYVEHTERVIAEKVIWRVDEREAPAALLVQLERWLGLGLFEAVLRVGVFYGGYEAADVLRPYTQAASAGLEAAEANQEALELGREEPVAVSYKDAWVNAHGERHEFVDSDTRAHLGWASRRGMRLFEVLTRAAREEQEANWLELALEAITAPSSQLGLDAGAQVELLREGWREASGYCLAPGC